MSSEVAGMTVLAKRLQAWGRKIPPRVVRFRRAGLVLVGCTMLLGSAIAASWQPQASLQLEVNSEVGHSSNHAAVLTGRSGLLEGEQAEEWERTLPAGFTIMLGGDLLLDPTLATGRILAAQGPAALMPGWYARRWDDQIDMAFANLESPVSSRGTPLAGKKYTFRADPNVTPPALLALGIDAVSLANNHVLDYGEIALVDTFEALAQAGVGFAGAGLDTTAAYAPLLLEREGLVVAFLAFADLTPVTPRYQQFWQAGPDHPGIATLTPQPPLLQAISEARREADIVVVSFHWGYEYADVVRAQRELGRAAIDVGADLVFGHHPHVPQPIEVYQGRPILYSLGNLAFQPSFPAALDMLAAVVRFAPLTAEEQRTEAGRTMVPIAVELYPLWNEGGRTITSPPQRAARLLADLQRRSMGLGAQLEPDTGRLVLKLRP